MIEALIHCSGADCEVELDVVVESLDELEGFGCDCGHGFVLLAVRQVELV